jgi:acetolactate synthase-1/3 small subunit
MSEKEGIEPRGPSPHHLLSLLVENKAGVLVRIAGLFARRGFNIYSLVVAPSDDERFSRVSIVVNVEQTSLQQILDQLEKLINVVEITELHPLDAVQAELLLATVGYGEGDRARLEESVSRAGAKIVDENGLKVTVMAAGHPDGLDVLEGALGQFDSLDLQRTGRIALSKLTSNG